MAKPRFFTQVTTALGLLVGLKSPAHGELQIGQIAPHFELKNHRGESFSLEKRRGAWTILFFYPKAETPGCTKQACAYRDAIEIVRKLGAEVYGISTDTVDAQAQFHKNQNLNFDLLADTEGKVVNTYGTKMPAMNISKRWTFVLDPELKIRHIDTSVDPVKDVEKMAEVIRNLQNKDKTPSKGVF